jgi:hypothetical protein
LGNVTSSAGDAGIGAFGNESGDVTITAGGNVYGHYVVANGSGLINAGQNAGASVASKNVALSLIKGSWEVDAPNGSIFLQEVRNPNGIFNDLFQSRNPAPGYHYFDYDPEASVGLNAGVGVFLTGQSLPRPNGAPLDTISLTTTKQTRVTVGGDMLNCGFSGQNLSSGDITSIDVTGRIFNQSAYSFVFLSSAIPSLPATDLPIGKGASWDALFSLALDPARIPLANDVPKNITPAQLASYIRLQAAIFPSSPSFNGNPGFVYDPQTLRLGYSGQMSPTVLNDLLGGLGQSITVLRYGSDGIPLVDSTGHFVTDQVKWANPQALQTLYALSQGAPNPASPGTGIQLGGPGKLVVNAGSISLGNSYGILSRGVDAQYSYLAPVTPMGASVDVTLNGNLEMLSSTIAALGGGDVNVTSLNGSMDLGSQELFGSAQRSPGFGIFTSGRGDVTVLAKEDIDVSGSRIAAYNGGNISVESQEGNVNAGNGGTAFINLFVSYVDPSGKAATYQEAVAGSGILATTLVHPYAVPGSAVTPGNISITTPQGSIYASLGGILQEALNGNVSAGPTITLTAGTPPTGTLGTPDYVPGYQGSINLGDSGVIGGTVNATANGNINGLVISRQNSSINAAQSFSGTVLSGGTANLTAGGSISGTVVGIGGISASGGQGISAALLSQNVSVAGAQAQSTLGTSSTATSTSQAAAQQASSDSQKTVTLADASTGDDEKKKKAAPVLTRKVGRVTVILPPG